MAFMQQQHKDFIMKELIPFIKREQGNGFAMEVWLRKLKRGEKLRNIYDMVVRDIPVCRSICCIGGSIQFLKDKEHKTALKIGTNLDQDEWAGQWIGLDLEEASALFYGWKDKNTYAEYKWPDKYQLLFEKANTPMEKAEVACMLLEKIVETDGDILDAAWQERNQKLI